MVGVGWFWWWWWWWTNWKFKSQYTFKSSCSGLWHHLLIHRICNRWILWSIAFLYRLPGWD